MKGRKIAGTALVALFSALLALFVYTRFVDKPAVVIEADSRPEQGVLTNNAPVVEGMVDFSDMAEYAVHAVVHVKTKTWQEYSYRNPIMEYFYGNQNVQPREIKGYGSGVIITTDGYIITNNHVVEDADELEVTLNDKRTFPAEVVGRDPNTDIALIKVDSKDLPYLKYGDSDRLRLGEWVVAIGNPFNLTSTVTAGIVSAKGRDLGLLNSSYRIESFIQTDAALNVGNSGGALVNVSGELVGITTAIISPSGSYAGNSFAVPVNIVKKVVSDLLEFGEPQRAFLGITIADVTSELAKVEKLDDVKGVFVTSVTEGGAAEESGLKEKDVILSIDGVKTDTGAELQEQVGKHRPGDKVEVVILRNNKKLTYNMVLKNLEGNTNVVRAGEGSGTIFGARLEPVSADELAKVNLKNGLKIASVQDGLFNDLGIKKGAIITEINGEKVANISDARNASNDGSRLRSIKGIQANGTQFSYMMR